MKNNEEKWVIFGTGFVGKSAFLILNKKVDFLLTAKIRKNKVLL